MECFPIVGGYHLDRVPRTAIEKSAIRSFADTFLTADTEVGINFDAAKGRMVLIRDPKHAGFYRAVLDAGRRTGTARAAVSSNCQDARFLFSSSFSVANRHGPMLFDEIVHAIFPSKCRFSERKLTLTCQS